MKNNEFIKFLILAKKSTYPKTKAYKKDGAKIFSFKKGDLEYHDTYYGSDTFSGIEIVFYRKKPIWSMSYFGGLTHREEKNEIYSFLKKALSFVSKKNIYRGPKKFQEKDFIYKNISSGNLENFSGKEFIYKNEKLVYHLKYIGGFIK